MSDIIRLLPDVVANQIAAGEVVQRPASVIKELVENAVDAGATLIRVHVTDAGKTSILVMDNGKGMSDADARMAFVHHATSKIHQAEDLFDLHTMGFRGEALASIAAVSQVDLKTRQKGQELGTHLTISGSQIESQEPVSCPEGSQFLVSNLFYNVPARRRFLKSNQTELSNIITELQRVALVHPDLHFVLVHNDAELLNLTPGTLKERIQQVFGKKVCDSLFKLSVETTLVKIHGFIASPQTARRKGLHQYFFVNDRFMRHPYFNKAVSEAYQNLIPEGEQVHYFIYFDVNPSRIDVNIHPTKTEIKFENEQAIWQILLAVVKETLNKSNAVPTIDFDRDDCPDIPLFTPQPSDVRQPSVHYDNGYNPFHSAPSRATSNATDWQKLYPNMEDLERPQSQGHLFQDQDPSVSEPTMDFLPSAPLLCDEKSSQHYQFKGRYILTSVKSGLMIVEQHRAHIRVLYEQYLQQLEQQKGISQRLLFPELIQVAPHEEPFLEVLWDDLHHIGFELSNLGGGSYSVSGIPAGTEGLTPTTLLRSILDEAVSEHLNSVSDKVRSVIAASLAHDAAIPVGQCLGNDEMEDLVGRLFACQSPNYTPDGKLTFSILRQSDIDRIF